MEDIPSETFKDFITYLPRASVEIVLETDKGVLLCHRTNEPAKGEWFWPGTLLSKGEKFEECVHRIAEEELGIEIDICCQVGTYSHFWETSKFEDVDTTHTVNVVYHATTEASADDINLDDQHDDYRFVTEVEDWMHPYVKLYLHESHVSEHW